MRNEKDADLRERILLVTQVRTDKEKTSSVLVYFITIFFLDRLVIFSYREPCGCTLSRISLTSSSITDPLQNS
jgi:hypothetical protein